MSNDPVAHPHHLRPACAGTGYAIRCVAVARMSLAVCLAPIVGQIEQIQCLLRAIARDDVGLGHTSHAQGSPRKFCHTIAPNAAQFARVGLDKNSAGGGICHPRQPES